MHIIARHEEMERERGGGVWRLGGWSWGGAGERRNQFHVLCHVIKMQQKTKGREEKRKGREGGRVGGGERREQSEKGRK